MTIISLYIILYGQESVENIAFRIVLKMNSYRQSLDGADDIVKPEND